MAKRPPGSARTSPKKRSSPPAGSSPFNRLLAALPPSEHERISSLARETSLKFHDVLHRKSEPVEYVYFPAGGICSLVTPLADGSMVEMAMVGSEDASTLRKAGLIDYRHGSMTILNRQGLESGSCECYRVVNVAFDTLVPELMRS